MKFRAAVTVLIIAACTTSLGADNQNQSFRIPGPEEIYEAYDNGFIDYQDYLELLEISRGNTVSSADSIFLMRFPDLLTGISSNPLLSPSEDTIPDESAEKDGLVDWTQKFLARQYHQFDRPVQHRQFYRLGGKYRQLAYHGEIEKGYTGSERWERRAVEYDLISGEKKAGSRLVLGNYKELIGMGLVYGYHGRLLSKAGNRDGLESLFYPSYGGGNGVLFVREQSSAVLKLIYDTDRNETFSKNLAAVSIPFKVHSICFALSAVRGQLRNRETEVSEGSSLISIFGSSDNKITRATWELAAAAKGGRLPMAASMEILWRRRKVRLNMIGWSYGSEYPSYFAGGPSSRRSRTLRLDKLEMSFSDRYAGETGVVVKTSYPIAGHMTLNSAGGYARRNFDDDRIEVKIGLKNKAGKNYTAKIDCYWRSDHLYSDIRKQRRTQLEIIRLGETARNRLVLGYRNDAWYNRDDFMVLAESRIRHRRGSLTILCKLDRLHPNEMRNREMYLTGCHEARLGRNLSTYVKYTYRYRKGEPGNSYGAFRLDLNWTMQ